MHMWKGRYSNDSKTNLAKPEIEPLVTAPETATIAAVITKSQLKKSKTLQKFDKFIAIYNISVCVLFIVLYAIEHMKIFSTSYTEPGLRMYLIKPALTW